MAVREEGACGAELGGVMRILVDHREARSGVPGRLQAPGAEVGETVLPVAARAQPRVGVERKTAEDFVFE